MSKLNTIRFFPHLTILATVIYFLSASIWATSTDFESKLNAVQSMQADFKQVVYDDRNKAVQSSLGSMSFVRPGKFRWQVKKPIPQLIIANGTTLWIYDPDLQQVVVQTLQKAVGETPALLLSHVSTTIEKDFFVTASPPTTDGVRWFELKPRKKESMFALMRLGFKQNQIQAMQLQDQLGHITKIQFSHAAVNHPIPDSTFTFKAPSGVDVIDETRKKPS
ncbi:MAG: outer membrane lipoprotein chaperone LolA [Gammaproteobacteria bacterium]|nr:outer membrane lipoprotein chaperone LolA [Gammaproteobacteria bacterium]